MEYWNGINSHITTQDTKKLHVSHNPFQEKKASLH